jgi:hypothetical protein
MPTNVKSIPAGFSQASNRAPMFWYDQHKDANYRDANGVALFEIGRPYWSWVERSAEGTAAPQPVGELRPMGWRAPWMPPHKYIIRSVGKIQHNGSWLTGPGSTPFFKIDYAEMMKEDKEATEAYYQLAVNEAVRLKEPMPRFGQPLSPEMMLVMGKPPRSPKIAEAAMAGDKWLLGQQMPVWDAAKQKMVVPENATLARLLKMGNAEYLTAQQDEDAQATEAKSAITAEMYDELRQQIAELKAANEDKAKKAAERMAKARAGKKAPATAGKA